MRKSGESVVVSTMRPLTLIMVFHKRKMEERRRQDITDRSRPLRILIRSTYTSASQIVDAPVWPRILG
jgi:hypothetical protein